MSRDEKLQKEMLPESFKKGAWIKSGSREHF